MDPDPGSAMEKKWIRIQVIAEFFNKAEFSNFLSYLFAYFMHIFADPDPGSQNLADPTDPNPKHCLNVNHIKFLPSLLSVKCSR